MLISLEIIQTRQEMLILMVEIGKLHYDHWIEKTIIQ